MAAVLAASAEEGSDTATPPPRPTKLARFLNSLQLRTPVDPLLSEPTDAEESGTIGDDLNTAGPLSAVSPVVPPMSPLLAHSTSANGVNASASSRPNPEIDSFAYIETVLESLAVLGKLGPAIDAVGQRLPVEMYNLVEGTVDEVEERNEPARRSSRPMRPTTSLILGSASSSFRPASISTYGSPDLSVGVGTFASRAVSRADLTSETLRDLFWTLFSKLDAVLQGFRVAYEVMMRVVERQRRAARENGRSIDPQANTLLFSLIEVWKPIQSEVRALLHDYLSEDDDAVVSQRNPIASVSDILRSGRFVRDGSKVRGSTSRQS